PVVGDAKLLLQVFSNLISNAIKYSPGGGPVTVAAAVEAGEVVVAVGDRGIGIPEKDREGLFARYSRGSKGAGIVGTRVGLYLVKMVLDLHHGRVGVESREGEGSRFTVRLPSALPRQEAPPVASVPASAPPSNAVERRTAAE